MTVVIEGAARILVDGVEVWPAVAPEPPQLPQPVPVHPFIAHRGAALNNPENTRQAFDWTVANGFPIELDLVQLADGHFAVTHDTSLNRTTNGSGNVSAIDRATWLELTCDVTPGVAGVTMTLDQVLDRYGDTTHYYAELKQGSIDDLAALLDAYSWARDHMTLMSFNRAACAEFAAHGYGSCYIFESQTTATLNPPASLISDGIMGVAIRRTGSGVTLGTYETYQSAGVAALAWTINDRATAQDLADAGVGVISDRPDYVSVIEPEEGTKPMRLRYNGLSGTLGAAHNDSTTTLTLSSKLTYVGGDVPTIASPDYLMLSILDSDGLCAEMVKVTAYTSGATTATIEREQEDTAGVAHDNGADFVHGPSAGSFSGLEHIASGSLGTGTTANISLPSGYYGFRLVVEARSSDSGGSSDILALRVRVGGTTQTGNVYAYASGAFSGSSLKSQNNSFAPVVNTSRGNNSEDLGVAIIEVAEGYDDAAQYTRWTAIGGHADTEGQWTSWGSGTYRTAAAVDGLTLGLYDSGFGSDSFETGSRYRLYGYTA